MEYKEIFSSPNNTTKSNDINLILNEKIISDNEKRTHSNEYVPSINFDNNDYKIPVINESNIKLQNFKKIKRSTTKRNVFKNFLRNLSKSFSKQYLLKNKRKLFLHNSSNKIHHSSNTNNKVINNEKIVDRVLPNNLTKKKKGKSIDEIILYHDSDIKTVRYKYSLLNASKLQANFQYGFNINYYKSISLITFEKYIEAMKIFYTTFTYKLNVLKIDHNLCRVSFNFYNVLDIGNISNVIVNLTYLNTITGICCQKYWNFKRDQTSFDVIKPRNTIILFELYQEGMNDNEHFGKGFTIF